MRINGFEQIKGFYSWMFSHQELDIKPQHMSIYLFLVNQNNRNNWVEWFKVPFDLGMSGSCISSKKTYYACLNDLQNWGLLEYEKGINTWKSPRIKLEVLKDTATVPQSEPQPTPLELPLPILQLLPLLLPLPTHNIKLLTLNLKPITDNLEQVIRFVSELKNESEIDEIFNVDPDKKSELIDALVLEFGFTEMKFALQKKNIFQFVTNLEFTGQMDHFVEQFKFYKEWKELSGEKKHSFQSLIGTPAMQFTNSAWNNENWEHKIVQYKADPANQTKFTKLKTSFDEAVNPYL